MGLIVVPFLSRCWHTCTPEPVASWTENGALCLSSVTSLMQLKQHLLVLTPSLPVWADPPPLPCSPNSLYQPKGISLFTCAPCTGLWASWGRDCHFNLPLDPSVNLMFRVLTSIFETKSPLFLWKWGRPNLFKGWISWPSWGLPLRSTPSFFRNEEQKHKDAPVKFTL